MKGTVFTTVYLLEEAFVFLFPFFDLIDTNHISFPVVQ